MKSNQITYIQKRPFAFLLICALLIGILPVVQAPISKATETSASVEDTVQSEYGLNNPSTTSDGITTWDCVWFGNYWQEDTNRDGTADKNDRKTPIKWRVLSVSGDDVFLLADTNLDVQKYNDTHVSVTWETCTMRTWLNSAFFSKAFSASEQAAIRNTTVVNEDNPGYGTEGGEDTVDKVYLLSLGEAMNPSYGFTSMVYDTDTREAKNTAYAKAQGAYTSTSTEYEGNGYWWLRSPGHYSYNASYVYSNGYVNQYGYNVDRRDGAVRPALHLNLSSTSIWSYAGTVTSDGGGTEIAPPSTPTPSPSSTPTPLATETPNPTLVPTVTESANPPATLTPVPTLIPTVTENPNPSITSVPSTTSAPNTTLPLVTESPSVGQNQVIMPLTVLAQDIISDEEQGDDADITLGKVTALKLLAKKKAIQASWKKVSSASGYELWYSTSRKFTKKKSKTAKKSKLTIKSLKQKKVYFVKVRAYAVKNGKKVYGAWSKTMKKKVE